jgi:hypothetical protein
MALPLLALTLPSPCRIEDIDEKAVQLADSASKFKTSGNQLKRKMRCRYYTMMALFGGLVITIIGIIAGVLYEQNKKK